MRPDHPSSMLRFEPEQFAELERNYRALDARRISLMPPEVLEAERQAAEEEHAQQIAQVLHDHGGQASDGLPLQLLTQGVQNVITRPLIAEVQDALGQCLINHMSLSAEAAEAFANRPGRPTGWTLEDIENFPERLGDRAEEIWDQLDTDKFGELLEPGNFSPTEFFNSMDSALSNPFLGGALSYLGLDKEAEYVKRAVEMGKTVMEVYTAFQKVFGEAPQTAPSTPVVLNCPPGLASVGAAAGKAAGAADLNSDANPGSGKQGADAEDRPEPESEDPDHQPQEPDEDDASDEEPSEPDDATGGGSTGIREVHVIQRKETVHDPGNLEFPSQEIEETFIVLRSDNEETVIYFSDGNLQIFNQKFDEASEFRAPPPDETNIDSYLDGLQLSLEVAGMSPAIGIFADIPNAFISLGRGNLVDAGFNALAAIPGIGQFATIAKHGDEAALILGIGAKSSDDLASAVRNTDEFIEAGIDGPATDFLENVVVYDRRYDKIFEGTVDLRPTIDRINNGGSYPHSNDGSFFRNAEGLLPPRPNDYYTEYVHAPPPGGSIPGPQRVIKGQGGELYYTPDHYDSFIPLNKKGHDGFEY